MPESAELSPQNPERPKLSQIIPYLRARHIGQRTINRYVEIDKTVNEDRGGNYGLLDHIRDQIDAGTSIRTLCKSLGIDAARFKVLAEVAGISYPDRLTSSKRILRKMWREDEVFREKARKGSIKGARHTKTPEFRIAQSERSKDYFAIHPEARTRMSERTRQWWVNDPRAKERKKALVALLNEPWVRERQKASSSVVGRQLFADQDFLKKFKEASIYARFDPEKLGKYPLPTIHGKRKDVGESQSTWEANVARVFTFLGLVFERRVPLKLSTGQIFSFDFLVYPNDASDVPTFFEILAHPVDSWQGFEQARKDFSNMEFIPITRNDYRRIQKEFQSQINTDKRFCGWETIKNNLKTNPAKFAP